MPTPIISVDNTLSRCLCEGMPEGDSHLGAGEAVRETNEVARLLFKGKLENFVDFSCCSLLIRVPILLLQIILDFSFLLTCSYSYCGSCSETELVVIITTVLEHPTQTLSRPWLENEPSG